MALERDTVAEDSTQLPLRQRSRPQRWRLARPTLLDVVLHAADDLSQLPERVLAETLRGL